MLLLFSRHSIIRFVIGKTCKEIIVLSLARLKNKSEIVDNKGILGYEQC